MSDAKNKFYELLVPKIEALSFKFKKRKSFFVKIENDIEYKIAFHWDGRGGTTILDVIELEIRNLIVQKKREETTGLINFAHVYTAFGFIGYKTNIVEIPVMYSQKTLNLANSMNFKALSQMPQDEKYPPDCIINSVNFVEDLIVKRVLPFFDLFKNSTDIYKYLCEKVENEPDMEPLYELVKCYSEILEQPLPQKLN
jgi:hypothetical protein